MTHTENMTRSPLPAPRSRPGVSAVLAVLAAFGLLLTDAQTAAVPVLVAVLAPLIVALAAGPHVSPAKGKHAAD